MCALEKVDVIVIGGSVGGLACAHALLKSGRCSVTVFERASAISAAGAVGSHPFRLLFHMYVRYSLHAFVELQQLDGSVANI